MNGDNNINNTRSPENKASYTLFKRMLDIILSVIGIVLLIPLFIAISVVLKISDGGYVFFVQERIGMGGKFIKIYKFRTMQEGSDDICEALNDDERREYYKEFRLNDDPRITATGAFLRKWGLDEIPQLLNIFQGRMSMVGPRPVTEAELSNYSKEEISLLQSVKPGLMGYWQAYGRDHAGYQNGERQRMELYYIANYSMRFDIRIFFKTFTAEVVRKEERRRRRQREERNEG